MITQLKKVYICDFYETSFIIYKEMIDNPHTHYEHFNCFDDLAKADLNVDLIITAIKPLTDSNRRILPKAFSYLKDVMKARVPIIFASGYEFDCGIYDFAVKEVLKHPFYFKKTSDIHTFKSAINRCLSKTEIHPDKYFSTEAAQS